VIKLAAEIRSLIAQNQSLQAKLDAKIKKIRAKNIQVNRDQSYRDRSYGNIQVNDKVETEFFEKTFDDRWKI
jgi:hypothetical protein